MDRESPTPERFAELIWRTVKLRVSLLIVSVVMLLVTWSGLTNGNTEAKKLDVDFCRHLEDETAKELSRLWPKLPPDRIAVCTPDVARIYIESGRAFHTVLPLQGEAFDRDKAELAEYDQKRRAAYKLEIGLSSQGAESKIIVNALNVAEVVPFVIVLIFSIVVVLGFQQNAYRKHLRNILKGMKSDEELNHGIVGSQFLSGFDIGSQADFGRRMALSPEGTAIWILIVAVSYLLLAVLAAFIINLIHLTNSIFLNYLCGLYTLSFILTVLLRGTHVKYQQHSENESKKTSKLLTKSTAWLKSPWTVCALSAMAIFSVFLPWTTSLGLVGTLKGYNFVLAQKVVSQGYGHTQYPIAPNLFAEIRFQLLLVALFLVISPISSFVSDKSQTIWTKALRKGNALLALLTLFLCLNYLLYMGTLEYGALTYSDFDSSLFVSGFGRAGGFAMSFYDPSYGFVLFLFCCLMLAWKSLRRHDTI